MRDGHGKTGRHKHKWTYVLRYRLDYFSKHGFKRSWVAPPEIWNVGELDEGVKALLASGLAKKVENGVAINLTDLGVEKLLG